MRVLRGRWKRPLDILAVGARGHVAASCSVFGVSCDVEVWDVATGQLAYTLGGSDRDVSSLAFTPNGEYLLSGREYVVAFCDAATGGRVADLTSSHQLPEAAVSADGKRVLVTSSDFRRGRGTVTCHALRSGPQFRELWNAKSGDLYDKPCFSPDGTRVAVSAHESRGDRVRNHVRVLDTDTGEVSADIAFDRDGSEPVEEVAFSADSSEVLARASSRTVKVFNAATGQPAGELVHPGRPYVTGMAVHPNGTVACSRNNGTVCLWDLSKRELVRSLDWKLGKLVSVAFAPDGSIGAAGTEDGQVVVWDVDE